MMLATVGSVCAGLFHYGSPKAPSKALNYVQVVAGYRLPAGFQQHPPYG